MEIRKTSKMIDLEHAISPILARQCAHGVLFDRKAAEELYATLISAKVKARTALQDVFKVRVVSLGLVTPKASNSKYGTRKGCEYTRIKFEEYNPSSRPQTIERLKEQFGWNPMDFTDKGSPKLDEEIIEALPFQEVAPLKEYMMVNQRLKQLYSGQKSFMKVVNEHGRIHGSVMQSGTVTGRMVYHSPNTNVPRVDKPYGKEFRKLFTVPSGKVMIGCDADGLEARTLGGYIKKFDGGEFIKALLEGDKTQGTDIHSINARAYDVDSLSEGREAAKQLFYSGIYGAKNPKTGLILLVYGADFNEYVPDFQNQLIGALRWRDRKGLDFSDKTMECLVAGKYCRDLYGERMPALPELIKDVITQWKEKGYLKGLDGRKLHPRSEHSAFNTLNQGAGAVIMKKSLEIADKGMKTDGLKPGRDYEFVINQHDEWQLEVTNNQEIIEIVSRNLPKAIKEAGEFFNFPCPMSGSVKVGKDWSDTH